MSEYETRQFWEGLPIYKVIKIIDFKIDLTSEPIIPWIKLGDSQENNTMEDEVIIIADFHNWFKILREIKNEYNLIKSPYGTYFKKRNGTT